MKRYYMTIVLSLFCLGMVTAQTLYDGIEFSNKNLSGTARFVGMGGAMGALGGDISTIGSNPAGLGIYRSNDVMTSFSFSSHEIETTYGGNKFTNKRNRGGFDNFGFVFSSQIGNDALRFLNFGFNYNRAKTFYRTREMSGDMGGSQIDQMITQANMYDAGVDIGSLNPNKSRYANDYVGWLGAIGYESFLFDPADDGGYDRYWEGLPIGHFYSKEWGGIDQYDFNVSMNFVDRVYFGVSVGAYDLNYKKYSFYGEDLFHAGATSSDEFYDLHSTKWIDGAGVDFKLGLIVRPFEGSPFRFGIAFHSPTYYKLTLGTEASLYSEMITEDEEGNWGITSDFINTADDVGRKESDFKLQTPWKVNLSLGHTIGSQLALGAEYEYQNNSNIKFKYADGVSITHANGLVNDFAKGVHTLRLGAEYNVIPQFAFRVGYNFSTASVKKEAFKVLAINSIETDTDYANAEALNRFTVGMGYRGRSFYADLGYQFNHYKEKFYAFDNKYLDSAESTNSRSHVVMTLGFRF